MLLCADIFTSGWRSAVNGKPVPLLQVNYLQMDIWFDKGTDYVERGFHPLAITIWYMMASVGLLMIISLIVVSLLQRVKTG